MFSVIHQACDDNDQASLDLNISTTRNDSVKLVMLMIKLILILISIRLVMILLITVDCYHSQMSLCGVCSPVSRGVLPWRDLLRYALCLPQT